MCFIAAALILLVLLLAAIHRRVPLVRGCFITSTFRHRSGHWQVTDALAIVAVWFFLPAFLFPLCDQLPRPEVVERMSQLLSPESSPIEPDELRRLSQEHSLAQIFVLARRVPHGGFVLAGALLVGALLVPVTEEFIFRIVLQRTIGSIMAGSRLPSRPIAIVFSALFFAAVHIRSPEPIDTENFTRTVVALLTSVPMGAILTLLFAWVWLRRRKECDGEILFRLDRNLSRIGRNLLAGIGAFFLFLPILALLEIGLSYVFPNMVTDPIPLFFFALLLGILADRSGRLAPSVGTHMALNSFSFLLLAMKSCA